MFDDPDYQPAQARAHPRPATPDLTNRWPLHGDPMRLVAAAEALRASDAEQIFGTRFPGEYVMNSVARLLEAVAHKIRERVDLGHEVVSAATDIAEHVLVYLSTDKGGGARTRPYDPRSRRGNVGR